MAGRLKICFFSTESYGFFTGGIEINHGGAELQIYLLAKNLAQNGNFDVSVIVGNFGQKRVENIDNVAVFKSFNLLLNENIFSKLYKSIKLFILLIKINPDIIITTTANSIAGIISFYKIVFQKKHIHRTASLQDVDNSWISQNGFLGKIYQFGLKNADKILTQSNEHKKLLFKNHKLESEVFKNVFHTGIQQETQKKHILWVGRFDKIKNPHIFLELAKQMANSKLLMVCPFDKTYISEWQILKQEAEKIENLTFIDKIPFHQIQKIFNEALIFVNTSYSEGFPNTFLQSALAKTPVISLSVNPDNFITDYNCGFCCDGLFDELLQKTRFLINNEAERIIKGENMFNYLKENHDIDKIGKQLESIIDNLLK